MSVNGLTCEGRFFSYETESAFKIVQKYFTDAFNSDLIYSSDMQMQCSLDLFDCFCIDLALRMIGHVDWQLVLYYLMFLPL